jgi:predicted amidohydrolase YtcJ
MECFDIMNNTKNHLFSPWLIPLLMILLVSLACNIPLDGISLQPTNTPASQQIAEPTQPTYPTVTLLPNDQAADIIFYNGTILTMDEKNPQANAIAIKGEKIMAVGNNNDILALKGTQTRLVYLAGSTLMPGFVDAHSHLYDTQRTNPNGDDLQAMALQEGVTTIGELASPQELIPYMQDLQKNGNLRLRANLYMMYTNACGDVLGDWYKGYPPTRTPGEMLRISGVKIFSDGGSCNVPAVSYEYPGNAGHGDLYFTQEQLNQMVADIQAAGYQVAIHALGDRAIEEAQNAIQAALAGQPNTYRHRIEHNAVLRPELIPRYSQIGIIPVIFGAFPTCVYTQNTGQFKYITPPEYRNWEWPWRPLMDANPDLPIAWHADFPVYGTISPMVNLYGLVTRKSFAEDGVTICEPPDWAADDRLSVDESLPLMTRNSAYALFRDQEVGILKAGMYADMIILSENPLTVEADTLKDISVVMTMVGGKLEYCAEGNETLCP